MRSLRTWKGLFILACAFALLGALFLHKERRDAQASDFFERALAAADVTVDVTVAGRSVRVENGRAQADNLRERVEALRVAYAYALARYAPLLALPKTDPRELGEVLVRLESIRDGLSGAQETAQDAMAVKKGLYPVAFLRALAQLERSRLDFLADPSDEGALKYQRAQETAARSLRSDVQAHTEAFERVVPPTQAGYGVFGGVMTRDSIVRSISSLSEGADATTRAVKDRERCLMGSLAHCPEEPLRAPSTEIPAHDVPFPDLSTVRSVRSLFAQANGNPEYSQGALVQLSSSACLASFDTYPVYSLQHRRAGVKSTYSPEWASEVLFVPSDQHENVPFYRYFKDKDVEYVYFPALEFYKCPELAYDFSRIFATLEIQKAARALSFSRYATSSPALKSLEARLINPPSGVLRERDAIEYIAAARENISLMSHTDRAELDELALMLALRTAQFDKYIARALEDEWSNLNLREKGVPVELSAPYLFFAKSGFYGFFQGANDSVAGLQQPPLDRAIAADGSQKFVTLSSLQGHVSPSDIRSYFSFFFRIHRDANASDTDGI